MNIRTAISSFALVSAMTLSGAALAQEVRIGNVVIPQANLYKFQEKCQAINYAKNETLAGPVDDNDDDDDTATGSTVNDDNPDPASNANLDTLLAGLTPEQCIAAGLVDPPVPATAR